MKYISKEDIFAAILTAASSGRRMTLSKLIFSCYIRRTAAIRYTATLMRSGMLEFDNLDMAFTTTNKGFKFLTLHNETKQISRACGKDQSTCQQCPEDWHDQIILPTKP